MPSVDKGSKVLVSGANGYIGMWIVRTLLERGFAVRGAVRTEDKGKFMKEYFKSLGYDDKFEVVLVDDVAKEGTFDEAVKGVHAIVHTASPVQFSPKEPDDVIKPAIQGTLGILNSALKNGSEVQRIVITSSVSAIIVPPVSKPTVFSEQDWNLASEKEIEELGNKCQAGAPYCASKKLSEKAAWDFYEQHKPQIKWDLVAINPPFVFGPVIHQITSPSSLGFAMGMWYYMVVAEAPKTKEILSEASSSWVDVRDTALSHVLALEKDAAGGQRIIISNESFYFQEWIDVAKSLSPDKIPPGFPEINQSKPVGVITLDNSKQASILGIKFRTKLETTKDILEGFSKLGM